MRGAAPGGGAALSDHEAARLPDNPPDNDRLLRAELQRLEPRLRPPRIILTDADRTLCPEDTGRTLLELAGRSLQPVREAFARHGYRFAGFHFHASYLLQLPPAELQELAAAVARQVRWHPGAVQFLHRAVQLAEVVIVTAGVGPIWEQLLEQQGLTGRVTLLAGIRPTAPYVLGRREKGRIAGHFRRRGWQVTALGDSDVDRLMLAAAQTAVVVVNHRRNQDLLPQLGRHRALYQISPADDPHPGIPRLTFATALAACTAAAVAPRQETDLAPGAFQRASCDPVAGHPLPASGARPG